MHARTPAQTGQSNADTRKEHVNQRQHTWPPPLADFTTFIRYVNLNERQVILAPDELSGALSAGQALHMVSTGHFVETNSTILDCMHGPLHCAGVLSDCNQLQVEVAKQHALTNLHQALCPLWIEEERRTLHVIRMPVRASESAHVTAPET